MDTELKDWLYQQFKDCEDGKLTQKQKELFLETMEDGKEIPEIQEVFKKYIKSKEPNSS